MGNTSLVNLLPGLASISDGLGFVVVDSVDLTGSRVTGVEVSLRGTLFSNSHLVADLGVLSATFPLLDGDGGGFEILVREDEDGTEGEESQDGEGDE